MIRGIRFNDPCLDALDAHIAARVEGLSRSLEGDHDPIKTAKIRGQLAELRVLLRDIAETKNPNTTSE